MNKKLLTFGIIGLFAVVLVSAALIEHYGLFQQEINVNQPIEVIGDTSQTIPCEAGLSCDGTEITISNDGTQEIDVSITNNAEAGIEVVYSSQTTLTEKVVDFTKNIWEIPGNANTVNIKYTVVGNEFSAEVPNPLFGYELIYYKDNSNRFANPAQAILVGNVVGNLPYDTDGNVDEYDYCDTGEYDTCHGAKIWYVPSSAIIVGDLDWSRADEFYYETELIQYNLDGDIITYPNNTLTIVPTYSLDSMLEEGTYTVDTTIA